MYQLLRQIVILASAIILIAATGGIHLIQHYCNCTHEFTSSIIVSSTDCHPDDNLHSCTPNKQNYDEERCCQPENIQTSPLQSCETNHNCCTTEYKLFKTDQYNYITSPKNNFNFVVAYVKILESDNTLKDIFQTNKPTIADDLPPPKYGKNLLVALHQFKIASPTV
jgi:hypothetical protein